MRPQYVRLGLMGGAVCGVLAAMGACDPCAGTAYCNGYPRISYTGEFVERQSGVHVPGVQVRFVRQSGARFVNDTVDAIAGADGFFVLRMDSYDDGAATGDFIVTPPAPHAAFTVHDFVLRTSRRNGNGGILGRLVVNPYLQLVTEALYADGLAPVAGATVTVRQIGPVRLKPDSFQQLTSDNGRFLWEPTIVDFGPVVLEYDYAKAGDPWIYRVRKQIDLQFVDEGTKVVGLQLHRPRIFYIGETLRRGNGERRGGPSIFFTRTSGVEITPSTVGGAVDSNGKFSLRPNPTVGGVVVGDLTIVPPAPFPSETRTGVELRTSFDDSIYHVGLISWGPGVFFKLPLVQRATGLPVASGTQGVVTRVGGLPLVYHPSIPPSADSGIRDVETAGYLPYTAATDDTGTVTFDIDVRLSAPSTTEKIRGIVGRAKYSDPPEELPPVRVGAWINFEAQVREAGTEVPLGSVDVSYQRTSGGTIVNNSYTATTTSDGKFLMRPVPTSSQAMVGSMLLRLSGFRDTAYTGVTVFPKQDDTLRSLGVFYMKRP